MLGAQRAAPSGLQHLHDAGSQTPSREGIVAETCLPLLPGALLWSESNTKHPAGSANDFWPFCSYCAGDFHRLRFGLHHLLSFSLQLLLTGAVCRPKTVKHVPSGPATAHKQLTPAHAALL
jgi:hypothetical protein